MRSVIRKFERFAYLDAHLTPTIRPRNTSFTIHAHASRLVPAITACQHSFVVLGDMGSKLQFDLNIDGAGALDLTARAGDAFILNDAGLRGYT